MLGKGAGIRHGRVQETDIGTCTRSLQNGIGASLKLTIAGLFQPKVALTLRWVKYKLSSLIHNFHQRWVENNPTFLFFLSFFV